MVLQGMAEKGRTSKPHKKHRGGKTQNTLQTKEEDERLLLEDEYLDDVGAIGYGLELLELLACNDAPKSKHKKKSGGKKKAVQERPTTATGRKRLKPGVVICTLENRYEILSVLGAGGFGDVYKVRQLDAKQLNDDVFALKTELSGCSKNLSRLKIEMNIFHESSMLPEGDRRHFVRMIDKGRTEYFKFIVMELVGKSLDRLQKKTANRSFSMSTSIQLALQTMRSIADLHNLGWLHRDIKPQNFAIGIKERSRTIFILDFGIARRYMDQVTKAVRLPRETVKFIGTVRFASRSCHWSREQGRKDDLESWIFMFIEFTKYGSLPWAHITDRRSVCNLKEELFAGTYNYHIGQLPAEVHRIMGYINELKYESAPDYEYIDKMLRRAAVKRGINLSKGFDWELKIVPAESESLPFSKTQKSSTGSRQSMGEVRTAEPKEVLKN